MGLSILTDEVRRSGLNQTWQTSSPAAITHSLLPHPWQMLLINQYILSFGTSTGPSTPGSHHQTAGVGTGDKSSLLSPSWDLKSPFSASQDLAAPGLPDPLLLRHGLPQSPGLLTDEHHGAGERHVFLEISHSRTPSSRPFHCSSGKTVKQSRQHTAQGNQSQL